MDMNHSFCPSYLHSYNTWNIKGRNIIYTTNSILSNWDSKSQTIIYSKENSEQSVYELQFTSIRFQLS